MAEQVEVKKASSNLKFDDSNVEKVFTDVVQVSVNQETFVLDLATRNKDNESADVSHRVYFTIPHFRRFLDVCNRTLEKAEKEIEKLSNQEQKAKEEDASN